MKIDQFSTHGHDLHILILLTWVSLGNLSGRGVTKSKTKKHIKK